MKWLYAGYSKTHINKARAFVSVAFAVLAQSVVAVDTPYIAQCRAQDVPIPPDWAETGTAWELQGNLRTGSNLLEPGQDAFVWTYTDPSVRGACIALPRGSGASGSLAGIICQSATTGAACFWDNMPKNDQRRGILGWKNQTLRISDLADGSNLTGVTGICTNCHRGNNVFLISPDDPTWARVLRGPLVTNPGSTFTTRVEVSSDNSGGHPRYVPITQPGWNNTLLAVGCAGACHEQPTVAAPPMPPTCAAGGVENCYGQPAQNNLAWLPSVLDFVLAETNVDWLPPVLDVVLN